MLCDQDSFAPSAGVITIAESLVVLPGAAGTNSVGILRSYTHGFRAARLAKVRSSYHFPIRTVTQDASGPS